MDTDHIEKVRTLFRKKLKWNKEFIFQCCHGGNSDLSGQCGKDAIEAIPAGLTTVETHPEGYHFYCELHKDNAYYGRPDRIDLVELKRELLQEIKRVADKAKEQEVEANKFPIEVEIVEIEAEK